MSRVIWCRWCANGYTSVAGDLPRVCPSCDRETVWTTTAPTSASIRHPTPKHYTLSENDRRFLKSIRIDPEEASVISEDDGS